LVVDADTRPAIAYLALGVDDGAGHRMTELRLVRAASANPNQTSAWTSHVLASAPGSCGGLCGSDVCVVGAADGDPQVCATATTDCTGTCGDDEVCVAGACRTVVPEPTVTQPPLGTGLY